MTSQRQRINASIKRLRPTLVQVQLRRPVGFSRREADSLAGHLVIALDHLEAASGMYEPREIPGMSRMAESEPKLNNRRAAPSIGV